MKKNELVCRDILFNVIEKKNRTMSQSEITKKLNISLSTVNLFIKKMERMNAVKINNRSFNVTDARKMLFYWASVRNIEKDIIYRTRVDNPVKQIESEMPDNIVFTAYSAYKFKFKDVPADYSEVYVYGDYLVKRFPVSNKTPNLFVLKKDSFIEKYGKTATTAQMFVDLWNLKEWYAKDFLKALEAKINGILE